MRGSIVLVALLASCGIDPKHRVGNEEVDLVLATVDPLGTCVLIDQKRTWVAPEIFKDQRAQAAARKIGRRNPAYIDGPLPYIVGRGNREHCTMTIFRPAYADDFAFLRFSGPGAESGVFALRKVGNHWTIIERERSDFW